MFNYMLYSPGIGNSQAATVASIFYKNIESKIFIILTSSINTINFILSIITFYLIERARNGAILAISQITNNISFELFITLIIITIIVSFIAYQLNLEIGKIAIIKIQKLNIKKINISISSSIILMIFFLTNLTGILILVCSTSLGLLCICLNVRRVHLMNILIIPVVFNLF